jgi:hypothetical protein
MILKMAPHSNIPIGIQFDFDGTDTTLAITIAEFLEQIQRRREDPEGIQWCSWGVDVQVRQLERRGWSKIVV